MAPSELASEKFYPGTHHPPFGPCFHSGRWGVSRTVGGPDAGPGRSRPRAGARGGCIGSAHRPARGIAPSGRGPWLRRGHPQGNDRGLARGRARGPPDPDTRPNL
eukprot:4707166-Pleurochrysis_carterae.AAC.1